MGLSGFIFHHANKTKQNKTGFIGIRTGTCFFFSCTSLKSKQAKKFICRQISTHLTQSLQDIVSIDEYCKYFFSPFLKKVKIRKKKSQLSKFLQNALLYLHSRVHTHCPWRRDTLFFPFIYSRLEDDYWLQCGQEKKKNLIIRCTFIKKKMPTAWIKWRNPVCVLVLGVTHASVTSANRIRKKEEQKKEMVQNLRLFLDVMRTRTIAFTVTFTARYCTQTRELSHTPTHTHTWNPHFLLPACLISKQTISRTRARQKKKKKYIRRERGLSPVCPGRRARPWPGSGACCGSPWCSASCRAPAASSPAWGRTPP